MKKIKPSSRKGHATTENLVSITPDVRLLRVLRNSGFNTETALGELLDNSVDAGATEISVNAFKNNMDKDNLMITDNGKGMNAVTLKDSLTLAKELKAGIDQLGKFGMGMKTASLSFSTMFEVYTKTSSGDVIFGEFNINKMEAADAFQTEVRPATDSETEFFWKRIGNKNRSGTVILIKNCDRFKQDFGLFIRHMNTFIGLTYKHYIHKGVKFHLSSPLTGVKEVTPIDVLMREHSDTVLVADREIYPVEYTDEETKKIKKTYVEISVGVLPKPDSVGRGHTANKIPVDIPINQSHQGIYVYREGRMVGRALTWKDVYGERHNSKNRVRVEIHCKSDLDDAVNMNYQKGNVHPENSLKKQWGAILAPLLQRARDELQGRKPQGKPSPEDDGRSSSKGRSVSVTPTGTQTPPSPGEQKHAGTTRKGNPPKSEFPNDTSGSEWDDSEDWINLAKKLRAYLDKPTTPTETKEEIRTILSK